MGLLAGVTVIDLGTMGPGARASRFLADYGARVIRVDGPPTSSASQLPYYAYGAMRGIERIRVDLKSGDGRRIVMDLVDRSDVLIEGMRPGTADRLGIGYDAVRSRNPRLVYCSATGYGQTGPYATWAGHDLDYLAVSGFLATSGRSATGEPALPGATVADAAGGGLHAALAIVVALYARLGSGQGRHLDVAAVDGMLGIMSINVDESLATGIDVGPGNGVLTGRYACYRCYECSDGRFVAVAAIEAKFFANLCHALEIPSWIPRQYDDESQPGIADALGQAFATRPRDEWTSFLGDRDACVAPVLSVNEIADNPHVDARGLITTASSDEHGQWRQVGPVLAGTDRSASTIDVNATDSAEQILRWLNYDENDLWDLLARRVVS